ncbi:putative phage abortive infection protein [Lysinibacillus xylanilyticus]|uniref:putative phage abortive infection protein n=1 Tax=Lysinibacillus xylanilyticus TaxID=582475 RepID=UPI0038073356
MNNIILSIIFFLMLSTIVFLIKSKKNISKLFLSILIFVGVLIGAGLLYLILMIFDNDTNISDTIKTMIPLIASMVAAASVVIATYNTVNGEKSSKNKTILEFIDITRDILEKGEITEKTTEILEQINSKLKSTDFKVDVLVNNGAREFFEFLNAVEGKEKIYILDRLEKCFYYEPGSPLDDLKKELIRKLKSNNIKDMRKLWVNINQLAGTPAKNYNILYEECSYSLTNQFIEKDLVNSKFYTDSLLKNDRKIVDGLLRKHFELKYEDIPIQYYEVYRVCNNILESNYEQIGHFFRTVHRTLKTINSYYERNSLEYREHIGMLRAQIPNQVALLMFYNAVYSEKGRGMARELLASNFFGDRDDFHFENNELLRSEHFLNNGRFLNNQDAHIAYELFTYNKESNKVYNELEKMEKKVVPVDDSETKLKEEIFTHYLFNKEKILLDKFIKEFHTVPRKFDEYKIFMNPKNNKK